MGGGGGGGGGFDRVLTSVLYIDLSVFVVG